MMTKGIIAVAAAFMLALTVGILTANMAESGNDRASNPTIRTLVLRKRLRTAGACAWWRLRWLHAGRRLGQS